MLTSAEDYITKFEKHYSFYVSQSGLTKTAEIQLVYIVWRPRFELRPPEYKVRVDLLLLDFKRGIFASHFGMAHLQFPLATNGPQVWKVAENM